MRKIIVEIPEHIAEEYERRDDQSLETSLKNVILEHLYPGGTPSSNE
jgi:hypothetical protein